MTSSSSSSLSAFKYPYMMVLSRKLGRCNSPVSHILSPICVKWERFRVNKQISLLYVKTMVKYKSS